MKVGQIFLLDGKSFEVVAVRGASIIARTDCGTLFWIIEDDLTTDAV